MTTFRQPLVATLGVLVALSISACGTGIPSTAPTTDESTAPGTGRPPRNWDEPFPGDRLSSYSEARASVSYSPIEPRNLGDPVKILVNRSVEGLAFLFDHPTYGRVIVIERRLGVSEERYLEGMTKLVAGNDNPGRVGTAEIVEIRGGTRALTTTAEDGTISDIRWTERGLEILVEGPRLNQQTCVTIAEGL